MSGNQYDFHVGGWKLSHFIHNIDSSNTVSGKPVYYWINHQNGRVPVDAGYVALVNSTNIRVQNLDLKNNGQGVLLVYTKNSLITGNKITNILSGIRLLDSSNNGIYGNKITAQNNEYGIWLYYSFNNAIYGNNVKKQWCGIDLSYSSNNTIYHNNIINNNKQVYSYGDSVNVWDYSYPSGGNYWSDYEERYPNATEIDDSGIWDTPYFIDENNQDNYPLMELWSSKPSSPVEATQELIEIIETWKLPKGTENSLKAKLKVAIHMLDMVKDDGAIQKLTAFTNRAEMLREKTLTNEQADYLTTEAQRIIDLIEG